VKARIIGGMAILCAMLCMGADAQPAEDLLADIALPGLLQAEPQENYEDQLVRLSGLQDNAETAAGTIPSGFIAKAKGALGGDEVPQQVYVEDVLASAHNLARGDKEPLVMVEGLQVPDDDSVISSLLTARGKPGLQLTVKRVEGVDMPALPKEDQEPHPSPVLVIGRVKVAEVTPDDQSPTPYLVASRILRAPGSLALRRAVVYEANEQYAFAADAYTSFAKDKRYSNHRLAPQALYNAAVIADTKLGDGERAAKLYGDIWMTYIERARKSRQEHYVWQTTSEGADYVALAPAIGPRMDELNETEGKWSFLYRIMDVFTTMCGGNAGWGVILLAVVSRMLLWPLTKKQLRSTREMQALAPEIKKLQEKYKDDRQAQQKRTMELYKEHGVNPLGGCLPLLVQMPFLIALYRGIRMYIYQFSHQEFLWVREGIEWTGDNLAQPDMILLVLYTISMIAFQKFTAKSTPAADPQQAQMQQTMTYMMPIMFFFFFQNFPAAFMLYWLGLTVIFSLHQLWFNYTYERAKKGDSAIITMPSWPLGGKARKDDQAAGASADAAKSTGDRKSDDVPAGEGDPADEAAEPGAAVSSSKRKRRRRRRSSRSKRGKTQTDDGTE